MKRILATMISIGIVLSSFVEVSAAEVHLLRESPTLSSYIVRLFAGNGKGDIIVSYGVNASIWADSIGVEEIRFYTEDGDYVETVTGTTSNGLVCNNTGYHGGDFDYTLPSGESYYAEVVIFAEYRGVYDSRTVTTNTVWVR